MPGIDWVTLASMGGASAGLSFLRQMLAGGLALKLCLPAAFRGFGGYLRASLTSLLAIVVGLLFTAGLLTLLVSAQGV